MAERPTLPPPTKGDAGKKAFATYVVHAWAYSLATNDGSLVLDASAGKRPCQGCRELRAELARRVEEGWSVYPFEVAIDRIRLIESDLGTTARVRFDVPETKSFFEDGSLRNTSEAHPDSSFTVSMRREKDVYRLIGFSID